MKGLPWTRVNCNDNVFSCQAEIGEQSSYEGRDEAL
jgi:hypothetical protein